MNLSLQKQGKLCKASVLGQVTTADECQELIDASARCIVEQLDLEIYLFDAHTLPGKLIEALAAYIHAGHKLKLYAYENFLWHSLSRLGLPVLQVLDHAQTAHSAQIAALAIGGSAESLAGILHIIERLPVSAVSIFIVQHVLEDQQNLLDQLLRVRTEYEVVMPTHLMPIQTGTIYIAPPGHHMKVSNGLVYLTRDRKVQYARPSIDLLFKSVALEYGNRAIAILLCGFGQDGVEGCAEIRKNSGCVLIQNGEDCNAAHVLPDAAKVSAAFDYQLDLQGLSCFLVSLIAGRTSQPDDKLLDLFLEALRSSYGFDFKGYQHGTLERRIDKMIKMMGLNDFFEFQREVLTNPTVFQHFFQAISINVTSFFRHPEQFKLLRDEILPYMDSFPLIKIWSAGCATGEEAYSLAFMLDELGILDKSYIFATDINPHVLRLAEAGLFPYGCLEESQANYLKSGGKGCFETFLNKVDKLYLKAPQRLKDRILFHPHALGNDGVFNEFQLIVCRNVLIYFEPALQQKVMERFASSLHREGFLMLGPSESLGIGKGERYFSAFRADLRAYRWK